MWGWRPENWGEFSVKSAYVQLVNLLLAENCMSFSEERAFKTIWKSPAPSKVIG
ncbi:hypothetical protein L195_g021407, partial [Trifolium pratense]